MSTHVNGLVRTSLDGDAHATTACISIRLVQDTKDAALAWAVPRSSSRVALTLRMVGGLTVPEIARAYLVAETALGQRITRARAKIKAARASAYRGSGRPNVSGSALR